MAQGSGASTHATDEARRRIEMVLGERLFLTVFHPIVELGGRRVLGYEALTRFACEPARTPDKWFDEALAVGLGIELELAAVESALAQLGAVPDDAFLALNVSPATALSPELAVLLATVPVDRIVLELIESSPIDSYAEIADALAGLRRRGLRVAVDDLGSGFARLRHLFHLKPDVIKLDMALVSGVQHEPVRQAVVSTIASFADRTGAIVVAEGIEEDDELLALELLGVHAGQGWLFGKPGPLPASRVGTAAVA